MTIGLRQKRSALKVASFPTRELLNFVENSHKWTTWSQYNEKCSRKPIVANWQMCPEICFYFRPLLSCLHNGSKGLRMTWVSLENKSWCFYGPSLIVSRDIKRFLVKLLCFARSCFWSKCSGWLRTQDAEIIFSVKNILPSLKFLRHK